MKPISFIVAAIALIVGVIIGSFAFKSDEPEQVADGSEQPAPVVEEVQIKMASTFAGELVMLGKQGREFDKRLHEISGGTLRFEFFEPNALVPALEIFDAVSSGSIDAGWSAAGYWAGKIPALQFFTAVPFGPRADEMLGWYYYGGGKELFEDLYRPHNIHPLVCNLLSPEGSGWFREEITSLDDLKGLKIRFFGLGAKVVEKLGATTQLLAGGDIFPALELGTIDATEFSMPVIDKELGFYQVAKHYYFPGWHQPSSMGELIINLDIWNSFSETHKHQVYAACGESITRGLSQGEAFQFPAMKELQEYGVELHKWPPEILQAFRSAWDEVVEAEAAADPDFAKVWESLSTFRENYELWAEYGYLD